MQAILAVVAGDGITAALSAYGYILGLKKQSPAVERVENHLAKRAA